MNEIFDELASNFTTFVDLLSEVSEQSHLQKNGDSNVLRLYELWVRTGSKRAEQRLQRLGIQPLTGSVSRLQH